MLQRVLWARCNLPDYSSISVACAAVAKPKPAAYEFQDLLKAIVTAARQKLPYTYKDTFKV